MPHLAFIADNGRERCGPYLRLRLLDRRTQCLKRVVQTLVEIDRRRCAGADQAEVVDHPVEHQVEAFRGLDQVSQWTARGLCVLAPARPSSKTQDLLNRLLQIV